MFLIVITIIYAEDLIYYCSQGYYQFKVIANAKKISETEDNHSINKLNFAKEIKQFALRYGLKNNGDYEKIVMKEDYNPLFVLSASEEFSIKPYLWNYPFLGDLPYKGFYNRKYLHNELKRLKVQKFDIQLYETPAYSMLGIVPNLLLPGIYEKNEVEFAETIFHELVHNNYFNTQKPELNESVAEAIAEVLTEKFIAYKWGNRNNMVKSYHQRIENQKKLNNFLFRKANFISKVYKSSTFLKLSPESKRELKTKLFRKITVEMFQTLYFFPKEKLKKIAMQLLLCKNAFLSSFITYNTGKEELKNVFTRKCNYNFECFVEEIEFKKITP